MSTTDIGRKAENAVTEYLEQKGYEILERNWRTRWCEIDVVALKDMTVYFVEVKYRKNNYQGDGLEYITPKKLQQMHFAAELWVNNRRWSDDYVLAATAVTGSGFDVTDFIEL
jgi:uncharacterized protein (TIGR00252 family)